MANRSVLTWGAGGLAVLAGGLAARFYFGRRRADLAWEAARYPRFEALGEVKHLSILPLIDDLAVRAGLACEAGVAYLVRADDLTLLFDLGLNQAGVHPSPLLQNMAQLGVAVEQADAIVISHLHVDHVGGQRHQLRHTFGPSAAEVDLGGKPAYVPAAAVHATARVMVVDGPRRLAPGVASLGPIARQLFVFGWTLEQSLAVNVAGKGLVLIVGCGHPTLQRIVERAERLCAAPLYGVVGGLHFPVTEKPMQRYLGTDRWPWCAADKESVVAAIDFLRARHPQLVALSPHDSCAWSRTAFREAFAEAYRDIRVGDNIEV